MLHVEEHSGINSFHFSQIQLFNLICSCDFHSTMNTTMFTILSGPSPVLSPSRRMLERIIIYGPKWNLNTLQRELINFANKSDPHWCVQLRNLPIFLNTHGQSVSQSFIHSFNRKYSKQTPNKVGNHSILSTLPSTSAREEDVLQQIVIAQCVDLIHL